ncbi:bifunctional 4-hydroxy-2-oxoglutarate aldolase/2-dehydro-3-deoxy-phosphogluconate aldolase [Miniphocaeibacter halophilus]|uniref:Bifunctional 4-hydroxy-2-oxoglutarate aldolase/2-dehydro-3-deoxy-phosphogluconate aldolase n=1 Tax=Miniphocaeibacter halophilus TaxID=2931922 RepID=A0AC61MS34_9FIRM|nr:bifunctional 4-hydroxy-2-oxoglutarate aldolase/2-dehydro-3-deoxy-phosphogluconate aldolase [Miniphocaeibacter halophilus]QQK08331.1 bifunctional 4-hydroxy-2-oxoglutarate aldolase/2-dehydro-3-deoxy-phosphogluconate aldolase [Miniphocaeibacter halophilus]
MTKAFEKILNSKIIAIIRGVSSDDILPVANALLKGGINCLEVTFNHKDDIDGVNTLKSISKLKNKYENELFVGAGTVLTANQVDKAVEAGAEYIISPNVDEDVIKRTKELNKISIPGALTPSEAMNAYNFGADIIKIFPAGNFGSSYLKSIMAPLSHLKFAAVGAVDKNNIEDFKKIGINIFGLGSNLVNVNDVLNKNFDNITKKAELYKQIIG